MNWTKLAMNIPTIIGVTMETVERFKGAKTGQQKEAAVLASVKTGLQASEVVTGVDWMNDPALDALVSQYISSRVALQNFLTKKAPAPPEGVIVPPAA